MMQTVVVFGVPYTPAYVDSLGGALTVIFSLFPWDLLSKVGTVKLFMSFNPWWPL